MPHIPRNEIDILIGQRIRQQRQRWNASQRLLGESLGISFQQIQKYEAGTNKVAASLLYEIARQLDAPITYFFDKAIR